MKGEAMRLFLVYSTGNFIEATAETCYVGLPIDLLVYGVDALRSDEIVCIDDANPYFSMIRDSWGQRLREAFASIDNPSWGPNGAQYPLGVRSERYDVLCKITNPDERIV